MDDLVFEWGRPDRPPAAQLVAALIAEMAAIYNEDTAVPYDGELFTAAEGGGFRIVLDGGDPIACGGFIRFDAETCELKRMYVRPDRRGRGISRSLLADIESAARAAGYSHALLETGTLQPEAIGLYTSAGYVSIPNYPPYADREISVCFGRDL